MTLAPGAPPRAIDLVVYRSTARLLGRVMPCSLGRSGKTTHKREGDLATPAGIWTIHCLYWRANRLARPVTRIQCTPLGPQQGWSEAPDDPAYNSSVRHPHSYPADRMYRGDPLYDICCVTDQNTEPTIPGAGSAIFVHVWRRPHYPTAGCLAFERKSLLWILRNWQPRSRIVILPES